ncbi:MAG: carotenoid biosynthesis protein [Candidatus Thorarchaeota archaeon]|nr:carotenoid biosynthesis protein [Candidatus Thorarchaeota archaeon]
MSADALKSISRQTLFLSIISGLLLANLFLVMSKPVPLLRMVLMFLPFFLMLLFAFLHGWWSMRRGIVILLLIAVIMTFFLEWLSINFGVPFGHYHYTSKLGTLVLGVPWVIPLQWFNVLYPSYYMACIIFPTAAMSDHKSSVTGLDLRTPLLRALTAAALMVGWDLINDPLMATVVGMWIWEDPTEFFGLMYEGIPLSNYIGWAITVFVVVILFELARHYLTIQVHWVSGSPGNRSNILVLVPYAFNYLIQLIQALGLGTIVLVVPVGAVAISLSAVALVVATGVALFAYLRMSKCV